MHYFFHSPCSTTSLTQSRFSPVCISNFLSCRFFFRLPQRFWTQLIHNSDFLFDIPSLNQQKSVLHSMQAVSSLLKDVCSVDSRFRHSNPSRSSSQLNSNLNHGIGFLFSEEIKVTLPPSLLRHHFLFVYINYFKVS